MTGIPDLSGIPDQIMSLVDLAFEKGYIWYILVGVIALAVWIFFF